jgi:hypothetical protein
MVGKPNVNDQTVKGASMPTSGLNALDQEREASMADEGGASGATMEYQSEVSHREREKVALGSLHGWMPTSRPMQFALAVLACTAGAYAGYLLTRRKLSRAQAGGNHDRYAEEFSA